MAEVKKILATSVKKGTYLVVDGVACTCIGVQTSKPGKHGHAKCRIEAVGVIDDKKKIIVVPGHDKLDSPIIEKKNAQVLSVQGNTANVMDMESYETFDINIPDDLKEEVKEGAQVLYWVVMDEKILKEVKG